MCRPRRCHCRISCRRTRRFRWGSTGRLCLRGTPSGRPNHPCTNQSLRLRHKSFFCWCRLFFWSKNNVKFNISLRGSNFDALSILCRDRSPVRVVIWWDSYPKAVRSHPSTIYWMDISHINLLYKLRWLFERDRKWAKRGGNVQYNGGEKLLVLFSAHGLLDDRYFNFLKNCDCSANFLERGKNELISPFL